MSKYKTDYLTYLKSSGIKIDILHNDPLYRKYFKMQNIRKMGEFEKKLSDEIKNTFARKTKHSNAITKKSILNKLEKKLLNLKSIVQMQRHSEWCELHSWLKDFHDRRIFPCLSKDLFSESFQMYVWGEVDEDNLLVTEHFELIRKIYHSIQYGRHDFSIMMRLSDIELDKGEARINEIVDSFYDQLNSNKQLKQKFIEFIKQFDLHSYMCAPDFEEFFLDWWDVCQFLIKTEEKSDFNFAAIEAAFLKQLCHFPDSIKPLNFQPRLQARYVDLSSQSNYLKEHHYETLCLTLDVPALNEMPIEKLINEYLIELSHLFSRYGQNDFRYQKRAIEISDFQYHLQSTYHKLLKTITLKSLNVLVVEILYMKWSFGREDKYSPFEFMKELIIFFDQNSDRMIEYNFSLDEKLSSNDKAEIQIKAVKKDSDKNTIEKDYMINLYEITAGAIRKQLKRSLDKLATG